MTTLNDEECDWDGQTCVSSLTGFDFELYPASGRMYPALEAVPSIPDVSHYATASTRSTVEGGRESTAVDVDTCTSTGTVNQLQDEENGRTSTSTDGDGINDKATIAVAVADGPTGKAAIKPTGTSTCTTTASSKHIDTFAEDEELHVHVSPQVDVGADINIATDTTMSCACTILTRESRAWTLRPGSYQVNGSNVTPTTSTTSSNSNHMLEDHTINSQDQEQAPNNTIAHHGLVEAHPVLDTQLPLGFTQEVDPDLIVQRERDYAKAKHYKWFLMAFLVLCNAIVLGLVFGLKASDTTSTANNATPSYSMSTSPTEVPSSAPTGSLDLFVINLPNSTMQNIQIFGTPQYLAWEWLSYHQNITNLPEWRKKQLFALATFFYAFEGENWNPLIQQRWLDDAVDECDWYSNGFGFFLINGSFFEYPTTWLHSYHYPCNDNGEFVRLDLESLELGGLQPALPPEIVLLTSLDDIRLKYNDINSNLLDVLPLEIYQMSSLQRLSLGFNTFHGPVPSELGLMTNLAELDLNFNSFSGSLPSELGLMTSITQLFLSVNFLSGSIPSELGLMTTLEWLNLDENAFSGSLPSELGLITSMLQFSVYQNSFSGSIPSEFWSMTNMFGLTLWGNFFSGSLPSEIGAMGSVTYLRIQDNSFTGLLPSEVGLMANMTRLTLQNNSFSGSLPTEMGLMSNMGSWGLDISHNSFSGSLPSELGLMTSLGWLDLQNNSFSGSLPSELGLMVNLTGLSLSNLPLLTGTIPSELSGLSHFGYLNLSRSHYLFGTIPLGLCYLQNASCSYGRQQINCTLDFDCGGSLCGCSCPCFSA